ncbi:hypothetical protein [Bacteroides stercoris]|uniref:hypothetical protein n=1 Tax=Bacteroides stercoris TaxID=46506 RepID=UPI00125E45C6|nr:hypothetical protein [Bacteroides stercoris]KAB5322619.1 hypothetical protein F9951_18955 [Bacteroides stercoris]MTU01729.1 hypothetical protein [Parasutterella excrementihominis]
MTTRSRAVRWYGGGPESSDNHPAAAAWDDLDEHRRLLTHLVENFDGWAIATTPDGIGAYGPLPVSARIMAWHRPNAMPGGQRLISRWEAVIVFVPEGRRSRTSGPRVSDVLTTAIPQLGFTGAKPAEWTRWVLEALGYDAASDTVADLFVGSGAVTSALDNLVPGH